MCSREFEEYVIESEENRCLNCLKLIDYIKKLTAELKLIQEINKSASDELKNIVGEENGNLHTSEKPIYRIKNSEESASVTTNRHYKDHEEYRGRKVETAYHHAQTLDQKRNKPNLKTATTIPTVVNGIISRPTMNNNKKVDLKQRNKSKKPKILLLGDSQMRGCADILKQSLNPDFEVSGIVKPGAKTLDILSTKSHEDMSLNDCIVISAATNDISKNDSIEGLKNIFNFVKQNRHTNIIILETFHRHDLAEWSCVNKEIKKFNRLLTKRAKPYKHVIISRPKLCKQHFTRHGMHTNNKGKQEMCQHITELIKQRIRAENNILKLNAIPLKYGASTEREERNLPEATYLEGNEDKVYEEYAETQVNKVEEPSMDSAPNYAELPQEDMVHEENASTQANKMEETSTDPSFKDTELPKGERKQQTRTSNRNRRPPIKLSTDFL
jgi:hypothetical protein